MLQALKEVISLERGWREKNNTAKQLNHYYSPTTPLL